MRGWIGIGARLGGGLRIEMSFGCVFRLICEGCKSGCESWILVRFGWF